MQALERREQLVAECGVEADAVVDDLERRRGGVRDPFDADPRWLAVARELHRVADQVAEHLAQQHGIGLGDAEWAGGDLVLGAFAVGTKFGEHFAHHGVDVDAAARQRVPAEPREPQQRVDQLAHVAAAAADHAEQAVAFGGQVGGMVLCEHAGEAVDGPQRRTQVVRDREAERFHLAVCEFEFRRALGDPRLQGRVGVGQLACAGDDEFLGALPAALRDPLAVDDPGGGEQPDQSERPGERQWAERLLWCGGGHRADEFEVEAGEVEPLRLARGRQAQPIRSWPA